MTDELVELFKKVSELRQWDQAQGMASIAYRTPEERVKFDIAREQTRIALEKAERDYHNALQKAAQ